jgi:tetratricopeptide (TPR) repeat protein
MRLPITTAASQLGQADQALTEYNKALKNAPNAPTSLYGRGVAKLMKGDTSGSTADFDAAKRGMPRIAEEFTKVGVQAKPKGFF